MQIAIKCRNGVVASPEVKEYIERRFEKVSKRVSKLARLEIELIEERNPSIAEQFVVDAVLYLKGVKIRASDRSGELKHAIHEVSDELDRQVERHREKRRHRRDARKRASAEHALAVRQISP